MRTVFTALRPVLGLPLLPMLGCSLETAAWLAGALVVLWVIAYAGVTLSE